MRGRLVWLCLGALACAPSEDDGPAASLETCDGASGFSMVVNELTFGRQEPVGVTPGFDLDGRISEADDILGCNKPDLVSPDGVPGIDSAFSGLVPVLEQTEAAAVEGLVQDSIRSGELLLVIDVWGVDDADNDDCVSVEVVRAEGTPMLGTDGNLLDGQTFARHPTIRSGTTTTASIQDGRIVASGLSMGLELQVLDEYLAFDMTDGQFSAVRVPEADGLDDTGMNYAGEHWVGVFSGGVSTQQIVDEFALDDIDIADLIATAVPAAADLYNTETNECDRISITFEYQGIPAYIAADGAR